MDSSSRPSRFSSRYAAGLIVAGFDYAALSWLIFQADARGDVERADAYRLALIWGEEVVS